MCQFDKELLKLVVKGNAEVKLEKLAEIIYREDLARFGLEKKCGGDGMKHAEKSGRIKKREELEVEMIVCE